MSALPVQPASHRDGRRPLGVLVVAAVQLARAALIVAQLLGLGLVVGDFRLDSTFQIPQPPPGTLEFAISRVLAVFLIVASLAFGFGLLTGRRWGWVGAIVIAGASLAISIGSWWYGNPSYLAMVINVIAVFYLNQREVRASFGELEPGDRIEP
jgi:hypothetical protein